jgi:hypothetical protein
MLLDRVRFVGSGYPGRLPDRLREILRSPPKAKPVPANEIVEIDLVSKFKDLLQLFSKEKSLPAKPLWYRRLDKIIDRLQALPQKWIDSAIVEEVVGVCRRRDPQQFADMVVIHGEAKPQLQGLM